MSRSNNSLNRAKMIHLASFPQNNPSPVIEVDALGQVTFVNPAVKKVLKKLKVPAKPELFMPEDIDRILALMRNKKNKVYTREVRIRNNVFLETISVLPRFKVTRIYCQDITARRRAEDTLRQMNAELERRVAERTRQAGLALQSADRERRRLYSVLETLPVYVVLLSEDYHVPFANKFFRGRFGDSGGKRCYEYLFKRTEPCDNCETYKVMKTNAPHHWEWTGPDGCNYDIYDFPFTDSDGSRMIMEMGIDITQIRKAEAELKQHRDNLEILVKDRTSELDASNKELKRSNENLEQFAYVASHDLQEPLRAIASYSQLLERRYKDRLDQDANDFIDFVVDAASRMQKLITDLLSYSRAGSKDAVFAEVDCNEVLRKVTTAMSASIASNEAKITVDALPRIITCEVSLMQLFQNLIANALKFRGKEPPVIHIGAEQKQTEWVFSVRDNGIGIEPQYKEKIFLIFQRLHSRNDYPGTGIGLSICRKIVDNWGGRIWFESRIGKGTTFYFSLPKGGMNNG